MSAVNTIRTQAERAARTRRRILTAAVREFSRSGLAGARTEQIAQAAGVNKALLYYYYRSKEDLYAASMDAVFERLWSDFQNMMQEPVSAGERILRAVLQNFDRMLTHTALHGMMQQEMMRMHRGEEHRMNQVAERFMRPLWVRYEEVIGEGIASGEIIRVNPSMIRYSSIGSTFFYFLSAPVTGMAFGHNPLDRELLEEQRRSLIEYVGQAIFMDRAYGARLAQRVLASTPMPENINMRKHDHVMRMMQNAKPKAKKSEG